MPQTQEQIAEVVPDVAQQLVQERTMEQFSQEDITERIVEQIAHEMDADSRTNLASRAGHSTGVVGHFVERVHQRTMEQPQ